VSETGETDKEIPMTMAITPIRPRLSEAAASLKKAIADGGVGPMRAAATIMDLNARWEDYRQEAGGVDCGKWIRDEVTPTLGIDWFQKLAGCVDALGKSVAMCMHYAAVWWLASNVSNPEARRKVVDEALGVYRGQGRALVTLNQVKRVARKVGVMPKPKTVGRACSTCDALRKQLEALGVTPEV
jgi:hypothetical protein